MGRKKRIWNRNLQTKITIFLCALYTSTLHVASVVFKIFYFIVIRPNELTSTSLASTPLLAPPPKKKEG